MINSFLINIVSDVGINICKQEKSKGALGLQFLLACHMSDRAMLSNMSISEHICFQIVDIQRMQKLWCDGTGCVPGAYDSSFGTSPEDYDGMVCLYSSIYTKIQFQSDWQFL